MERPRNKALKRDRNGTHAEKSASRMEEGKRKIVGANKRERK